MKTSDWQLLKVLYTTKNLTRASRQLFITQPALTKRLLSIEQEFNCQVADRSNKGVIFTEEGEYLCQQADVFLKLLDETVQHVNQIAEKKQPIVRIGAPSTFAKYFLMDLLSEFHKQYPDIITKIRVDVSSEISHYIHSNIIDCGFTLGDQDSSVNLLRYDTQRCYAVYNKPLQIEDLPNLPLILYNRNESTQNSILQWYFEHFHSQPNVDVKVTDLDTALDMVANGLGYCLAFGSFLEKRAGFHILPLNNTNESPFIRSTWFLYPNKSIYHSSQKIFIDYVIQRIHQYYD